MALISNVLEIRDIGAVIDGLLTSSSDAPLFKSGPLRVWHVPGKTELLRVEDRRLFLSTYVKYAKVMPTQRVEMLLEVSFTQIQGPITVSYRILDLDGLPKGIAKSVARLSANQLPGFTIPKAWAYYLSESPLPQLSLTMPAPQCLAIRLSIPIAAERLGRLREKRRE